MEYTKPELVLIGQAESLVLGTGPHHGDPIPGLTTSGASELEFED